MRCALTVVPNSCCHSEMRLCAPQQHRDFPGSEGNYQRYIEDLRRRKGPEADQAHRIAYKKLVRG